MQLTVLEPDSKGRIDAELAGTTLVLGGEMLLLLAVSLTEFDAKRPAEDEADSAEELEAVLSAGEDLLEELNDPVEDM